MARLIDLKLEALAAVEDAGFGFEAIGLAVTRAEPMPARQIEFAPIPGEWGDGDRAERCAALIDALRQRLGPHRVRRFAPVASHLPERAEVLAPLNGEALQSSRPERGRSMAAGHRVGVGVNSSSDLTPSRLASLADPPLAGEGSWPAPQQERPLLLLPLAEPTEVTALVPDGPPRRFFGAA